MQFTIDGSQLRGEHPYQQAESREHVEYGEQGTEDSRTLFADPLGLRLTTATSTRSRAIADEWTTTTT